jgi:hypothetical protein
MKVSFPSLGNSKSLLLNNLCKGVGDLRSNALLKQAKEFDHVRLLETSLEFAYISTRCFATKMIIKHPSKIQLQIFTRSNCIHSG